MDLIKALLVDDEKENLSLLNHLLSKHCPDVQIIGKAQNISEALAILENEKIDLILLDIELSKGETGFDLIKKINFGDINPRIIFITAYSQYAINAIKIKAFDYILKPVSIKELKNAIENLKLEFETNKNLNAVHPSNHNSPPSDDFITIAHLDNLQILKCSDIIYMEASGKYTIVHCKNGNSPISSRNLGHYETILNKNFIRVHHTYIINVTHVKKIEKNYNWHCLLLNDVEIPVSRRKRVEISKAFEVK